MLLASISSLPSPILPPFTFLLSQPFSMAMSVQIPSSPSTSSSTHPPSPLTPPSISQSPSDVNADSNSATIPPASGKRKPSRRANTAERRATHNAVERQRRETLNSRFLVRSCSRFRSHWDTHRIASGSRRSFAKPLPNPSPLQVFYRQLVDCPHSCFSPIQVDCCP